MSRLLLLVAIYALSLMMHCMVANGNAQVNMNAPYSQNGQNPAPPQHNHHHQQQQQQDKRAYAPPSRRVRLSRGPSSGSSPHPSQSNPNRTNARGMAIHPPPPPTPPLPRNEDSVEGDLSWEASHHHHHEERKQTLASPSPPNKNTDSRQMTKEAYTAHPERFQPRYHSESADFGDRPVIIGICGGTGSGKTTLTNALFDRLGAEHVSCISHDSYYNDLQHLTLEERAHVNFDHPSSLDSNLLKDHLNDLKEGNDIECPVYDFTTHSRKQDQTVRIEAKKIVLVDGILIFAEPKLLDLMDMKIFVDTADDIRLIRRLQRDTEERARTMNSVIEQYHKTVRPMHALYVEPSKGKADIIVPTCDGIQDVALDMILSRLKEIVGKEAYK